jgi:hypothetical protein
MRRASVIFALALAGIAPAAYGGNEGQGPPSVGVTHAAPVPCSAACAYWLEPPFEACTSPFPPGSHDRTTFRLTVPDGSGRIHAWNQVDWDMFACTDTEPPRMIKPLGTLLCGNCYECRGPYGSVTGLGCEIWDDVFWREIEQAAPGSDGRFIIMSYNWIDPGVLPVNLWGPVEIVDDTFEAALP